MKYIYYPEYELEYRNLLGSKSPDHILNIRLLMFLCDHVILPPSHLFYTSSKNILNLIDNLHEFFGAGKIVRTDYQNGIDDYFFSRIDRIHDPVLKHAKIAQVDQIKEGLFFDPNVEQNKSDEKTQLSLFDARTKELILASNKHKETSLLLLDQMDTLSNRTGEPIYSNQFRSILTTMSTNRDITDEQYNHFLNLMSNAYYYSGTFTMNTPVSYNSYFEKINLQNSLRSTNAMIPNLIVNPYFLQKLFAIMGINAQDIYLLGVSDYNEIMNHSYWDNFMSVFHTLYTNGQDLEDLLRNRSLLLNVYKGRKEKAFNFMDIITSDLFLGLLLSPVSLPVGIGVPLLISLLRAFFPPVKKVELSIKHYTSDKVLDLIERSRDPLYEFSYRLNAAINALK